MIHIRPHLRATSPVSRLEEVLRWLGVHPSVAEQFAGDLAETCHHERVRAGTLRARLCFVDEILRSLPHLAWGVIRDGGAEERARLGATLGAAALVLSIPLFLAATKKGPPARLTFADKTVGQIVVNHTHPARLPLRVVDAGGRQLDSVRVDYRWIAGAPIDVSPDGTVTCGQEGDAVVRASTAAIERQILLRCRPVRELEAITYMNFLVGDSARNLSFRAIGLDGQPVTELRGAVRVRDSSVATLSGNTIRPLRSGKTYVSVNIGNASARIHVLVYQPARRLTGLRADEQHVAIPLRLARGDTVRFELPMGTYWLRFRPKDEGGGRPTMFVDGSCAHGPGQPRPLPSFEGASRCQVKQAGAWVILGRGMDGADALDGWLTLDITGER